MNNHSFTYRIVYKQMALPSPIQAFISSISYTYVLLCAELQMCLLHLFTKILKQL